MFDDSRKFLKEKDIKKIIDNIHYNGIDLYYKKTEWISCIGQRSNGKSFFWLAICTMEFFEFNYHLGYVRRQKEETTITGIEEYFSDENYLSFLKTNYGFDGVICKEKKLYFVAHDYDGKIIKEQTILFGKAFSLSTARNFKSLHYDKIENMIFEEFITDGLYLANEWKKWNNLISTIFRDRKGRVILIGNTIERNCPYFREMGINILKLKKGTITIFHSENVDFLVEYTSENVNTQNKMFIGQTAKQINKGDWDTNQYPHLFCDFEEVEKIMIFYYCYKEFCFKCEVFIFDDNKYLFIRPYNKDNLSENYYNDIFDKNFHLEKNYFNRVTKKRYKKIWDLFLNNKVVYSDNLCGTEFNNCLKYFNPFISSIRLQS